jgi:hypothetical protein
MYELTHNWTGNTFFDAFWFQKIPDPTEGFVDYASKEEAIEKKLIYMLNNEVIIKADNSSITWSGRPSIRIMSKEVFNQGSMIVYDSNHIPTGCGTWPAVWTVGDNWPMDGEIDIMEQVHESNKNLLTLHSGKGCDTSRFDRKRLQTASVKGNNCNERNGHVGCQSEMVKSNTFGSGFNKNRGGVYVTDWQKEGIKIWFFPRNNIPKDLVQNKPNPSSWGKPSMNFPFGTFCTSDHFKDHRIIINLTFCGGWAGAVWNQACAAKTKFEKCHEYVRENPSNFDEAYFSINSIRIFKSTDLSFWKNCVPLKETIPGRHHDWCETDFKKGALHVGQSNENCPNGLAKGICKLPVAWKKCVPSEQTSPGKHHDWCELDFGAGAVHVGQSIEDCPARFAKGLCALPVAWKNCVHVEQAKAGKHHDWCQNFFGDGALHVGHSTENCPVGQAKGLCKLKK